MRQTVSYFPASVDWLRRIATHGAVARYAAPVKQRPAGMGYRGKPKQTCPSMTDTEG